MSPPLRGVFHAQSYFMDAFHIHVSTVLSMPIPQCMPGDENQTKFTAEVHVMYLQKK